MRSEYMHTHFTAVGIVPQRKYVCLIGWVDSFYKVQARWQSTMHLDRSIFVGACQFDHSHSQLDMFQPEVIHTPWKVLQWGNWQKFRVIGMGIKGISVTSTNGNERAGETEPWPILPHPIGTMFSGFWHSSQQAVSNERGNSAEVKGKSNFIEKRAEDVVCACLVHIHSIHSCSMCTMDLLQQFFTVSLKLIVAFWPSECTYRDYIASHCEWHGFCLRSFN